MLNKLVIINNEKVFSEKNLFYCDNIEMKSLPEGLGKNFDISMILRKSKIQRSHQIKVNKINLSSNIFNFLLNIYKTFKNKETNYLLISITPYTFLAHFILLIFKRKIFLYLRSNGHEEYKAIFGFIGPLLYHLMYIFVTFRSKIIVCQNKITNKKKVDLVYPSQLDKSWLINTTTAPMDKPRLLYVGRIKVEKGIFSLVKILNEMDDDVELSILGKPVNEKIKSKKVNYLGYEKNSDLLKKTYDNHNYHYLV